MSAILFRVVIGGRDVSPSLTGILKSIEVTDGTDNEADSAEIVLSDVDGTTFLADKRDPVSIDLGRTEIGQGRVFDGFVDEVRSRGGSEGREITVSCKSVDLEGAAKEAREDYWDEQPLGTILQAAFAPTGVSILVDPSFASIVRDFEAMDGRNALHFAADLAKEVGATFKMMGTQAVFAQRNSGLSILGSALTTFSAAWGANLLKWDITPFIPHARFASSASRWFDFDANEWMEEEEPAVGKVPLRKTQQTPGKDHAKGRSAAGKEGSAREAGAGSVTVQGDYRAQAGGKCTVSGARPGIDGTYVISSVQHSASVGDGFTTTLELKHPEGGAGVDSR